MKTKLFFSVLLTSLYSLAQAGVIVDGISASKFLYSGNSSISLDSMEYAIKIGGGFIHYDCVGIMYDTDGDDTLNYNSPNCKGYWSQKILSVSPNYFDGKVLILDGNRVVGVGVKKKGNLHLMDNSSSTGIADNTDDNNNYYITNNYYSAPDGGEGENNSSADRRKVDSRSEYVKGILRKKSVAYGYKAQTVSVQYPSIIYAGGYYDRYYNNAPLISLRVGSHRSYSYGGGYWCGSCSGYYSSQHYHNSYHYGGHHYGGYHSGGNAYGYKGETKSYSSGKSRTEVNYGPRVSRSSASFAKPKTNSVSRTGSGGSGGRIVRSR